MGMANAWNCKKGARRMERLTFPAPAGPITRTPNLLILNVYGRYLISVVGREYATTVIFVFVCE